MSGFPDQAMTTDEFYTRLFLYRLAVLFAERRYASESQALNHLKEAYNDYVPQELWEKQHRRVRRAKMQLGVRCSILTVFFNTLLN